MISPVVAMDHAIHDGPEASMTQGDADQPRRTRRDILAAAAAGAAGMAVAAAGIPAVVEAGSQGGNFTMGAANSATDTSVITQSTAGVDGLSVGIPGGVGGQASAGKGTAIVGHAASTSSNAGVAGYLGDTTNSRYTTGGSGAGVYGWSTASMCPGVWGSHDPSGSGWGVYGDGPAGVQGIGTFSGVIGLSGTGVGVRAATTSGAGLHAHVGDMYPSVTIPSGTAIFASVNAKTQHGIIAQGGIKFSDRSGKGTVAKGKSSVTIAVSGITSSNYATATLGANRSGRWVRAVVCASGKITIYLNTTVTAATPVTWLVLG
jgi:hypothetical protein